MKRLMKMLWLLHVLLLVVLLFERVDEQRGKRDNIILLLLLLLQLLIAIIDEQQRQGRRDARIRIKRMIMMIRKIINVVIMLQCLILQQLILHLLHPCWNNNYINGSITDTIIYHSINSATDSTIRITIRITIITIIYTYCNEH